jgi:hypothetical protein
MIDPSSFSLKHIRSLQKRTKRDPALLERTLFAFGVLEALARAEMPFIFQGGTSLLLLLDRPRRISTDIDVVVNPGTDVEKYLVKTAEIFPFTSKEEQVRAGRSGITKRHFKFFYDSPVGDRSLYILLDVLYEKSAYAATTICPIANSLLMTSEPLSEVVVPTLECMAAGKLTAFAPHTTGIPFGIDKELEIIKQFYDIAVLVECIDDLAPVRSTYQRAFTAETKYRALDAVWQDGLIDTIKACVCIMGKGTYDTDEFPLFMRGIDAIKSHVFDGKYSGEVAVVQACAVMYLAASLLVGSPRLEPITNIENYRKVTIDDPRLNRLAYIRKLDLRAYAHLVEAIKLCSNSPYASHASRFATRLPQ